MMRRRLTVLGAVVVPLALIWLGISFTRTTAQEADCSALIQQTFASFEEACSGAGGQTACFGGGAQATFEDGVEGSFGQSGDTVPLNGLQAVQTNGGSDPFGLAGINVQANVPLALSATGLRFLLVGDVAVENAVDPERAFTPAPAVTVTPLVPANLRSGPSTDARVIGNAPVGSELQADALSPDGNWLRVLTEEGVAWISRQVVTSRDGEIAGLPAVGGDTRTLMQAFTLRTGSDAPDCAGAPPSMLIIQGPEGVNANLTVNGVNLRFSTAIALRVLAGNVLQIVALAGGASTGNVTIPAGFTLNVPLTADGTGAAGPATGLRPINGDERTALTLATGRLTGGVVYGPLTVPSAEQVAATLAQINQGSIGQAVAGPASGNVDCSRFRPSSPLGTMPNGLTSFYWDGAPGATTYRVNVFGDDGGLRGSFEVNAQSSTVRADTSDPIGGGSNFSWNVEALVNGQVACTSGRVSVVRDAFRQLVGSGDGGPVATPTPSTWTP